MPPFPSSLPESSSLEVYKQGGGNQGRDTLFPCATVLFRFPRPGFDVEPGAAVS